MTLKLHSNGKSITGIAIEAAEKHYDAKFVMDTCVKDSRGNWVGPVALFYGATEHPVSKSRYFALRVAESHEAYGEQTVYIMNGQSAVEHTYSGLIYNGEVYHSRYRHDFRAVGPNYIDGGLDYTRIVGSTNLEHVSFTIVDGEPVFGDRQEAFNDSTKSSEFDMDAIFDSYVKDPEGFWK